MQSIAAQDQLVVQQVQGLDLLPAFFLGHPLGLCTHPPQRGLFQQDQATRLGDGAHGAQTIGLSQLQADTALDPFGDHQIQTRLSGQDAQGAGGVDGMKVDVKWRLLSKRIRPQHDQKQ